jgi:hypothetical protein
LQQGGKLMPKSKHRRKAGGKAVKHPGRGKPPREFPLSAQFVDGYLRPFHAAWPDREDENYMLDLVSDACFDSRKPALFQTVRKDELISSFTSPLEGDDGSPIVSTREQAEAALAFLEEQDMVVIDGDQVSIPSRFVDEFSRSPAQAQAKHDQISAE